jgi:hypothetical protein
VHPIRAMEVTPFTVVGTASTVLTLRKDALELGISLSKLGRDTDIVDTTIKNLAGETKLLGNECDTVYTELEEVVSKSEMGSLAPFDLDGKMWSCLATQVEEINRTLQELEMFVKSLRGQESNVFDKFQHQMRLENSKNAISRLRTYVCRHTYNLRTTLLFINM